MAYIAQNNDLALSAKLTWLKSETDRNKDMGNIVKLAYGMHAIKMKKEKVFIFDEN